MKTAFYVTAGVIAAAAVAIAAAPDVPIRSTRTVVAATQGLGSSQVCIVTCDAPTESLACEATDPSLPDQEAIFDVTAAMEPGVPACFRAIALSGDGIQSTPSENAARGTIPAPPVIR